MYVYTYTGELLKLKLTDNFGQIIVDHKFRDGEYSLCEWFHREIPFDRDIIGLYCNTSIDSCYIRSLGFITWKPNQASNDGSNLGKYKQSIDESHGQEKKHKKKKKGTLNKLTKFDKVVNQLLHMNS